MLTVTTKRIAIDATTDLGVLHGLETLLQLLQNSSTSYYFPIVEIVDVPRFNWRRLMNDSARYFQPVDFIKRNLDAVAFLKVNVFHWHLVDNQGWRIELKNHPKLTKLASDGNFYTQEEV